MSKKTRSWRSYVYSFIGNLIFILGALNLILSFFYGSGK